MYKNDRRNDVRGKSRTLFGTAFSSLWTEFCILFRRSLSGRRDGSAIYRDAGPFGHGLSYTKFEYRNPSVDKQEFTEGDQILVSIEVENVGATAGKETVQLYISDHTSIIRTAGFRFSCILILP